MLAPVLRAWRPAVAVTAVLLLIPGCGIDSGDPDLTQRSPASQADLARLLQEFGLAGGDWPKITEDEINDLFDEATPADLSEGEAAVAGEITYRDDIDVYDIGPVFRGDRIIVTSMVNGSLDATAAVFDSQDCLLYANDDRIWNIDTKPYVNMVVWEDRPTCYVAIAASDGTSGTGGYGLWIEVESGNYVPSAQKQVVVLDFDGGEDISIGGTTPISFGAFEAGDIHSSLADDTAEIINRVESEVRADFADYDVDIYSTAEGDLPDESYTSIYFGGHSAYYLGLSDYVDYHNLNRQQQAMVYAETFSLFMPYNPGPSGMAEVLANVASHELGHLLGLNHTDDPTELMDTGSTAGQMLGEQDFHRTQLHDSIFPIGSQDSDHLLAQAVGRD